VIVVVDGDKALLDLPMRAGGRILPPNIR